MIKQKYQQKNDEKILYLFVLQLICRLKTIFLCNGTICTCIMNDITTYTKCSYMYNEKITKLLVNSINFMKIIVTCKNRHITIQNLKSIVFK